MKSDRFPLPANKSKIVISYVEMENPAKYRLKQRFLNRYRDLLFPLPNHKENNPGYFKNIKDSPSGHINLSLQQLDQLIKPELLRRNRNLNPRAEEFLSNKHMNLTLQSNSINYHSNIYSAEFLKRIEGMHNRQIDQCKSQFRKIKGHSLKPLEKLIILSKDEETISSKLRNQSFY